MWMVSPKDEACSEHRHMGDAWCIIDVISGMRFLIVVTLFLKLRISMHLALPLIISSVPRSNEIPFLVRYMYSARGRDHREYFGQELRTDVTLSSCSIKTCRNELFRCEFDLYSHVDRKTLCITISCRRCCCSSLHQVIHCLFLWTNLCPLSSRFRSDTRELPVLWHQSLLAFVQHYRQDISTGKWIALNREMKDFLFKNKNKLCWNCYIINFIRRLEMIFANYFPNINVVMKKMSNMRSWMKPIKKKFINSCFE